MSWEAIGAIAELLGAVGVIASLVYLGTQIRDGQRALRASTYQQFRQGNRVTLNLALAAPGLTRTVRAALDEDRWAMHRGDIVRFFARPGVIQWWLGNPDPGSKYAGGGRDEFSPEFVALVEEILGEQAEGGGG